MFNEFYDSKKHRLVFEDNKMIEVVFSERRTGVEIVLLKKLKDVYRYRKSDYAKDMLKLIDQRLEQFGEKE